MKTENLLLIGVAGYLGYQLVKGGINFNPTVQIKPAMQIDFGNFDANPVSKVIDYTQNEFSKVYGTISDVGSTLHAYADTTKMGVDTKLVGWGLVSPAVLVNDIRDRVNDLMTSSGIPRRV